MWSFQLYTYYYINRYECITSFVKIYKLRIEKMYYTINYSFYAEGDNRLFFKTLCFITYLLAFFFIRTLKYFLTEIISILFQIPTVLQLLIHLPSLKLWNHWVSIAFFSCIDSTYIKVISNANTISRSYIQISGKIPFSPTSMFVK